MTSLERKAVFSLAGIYSLRMFGLFMLLPVLSVYAYSLQGATPYLIGIALGAYGLTQAILQIPFGLLSDRIDRKLAISIGLAVFAVGSIFAASADTISELILSRCVQGAGAISAAILALTADLTRSNQRTKAMALIGISIGATFMLSLVLAPVLQAAIGMDGLFLLVAMLAVIAVFVLYLWVPDADPQLRSNTARESIRRELLQSLKNTRLLQLDLGIFISHMVLTALFVVLPVLFIEVGQFPLSSHWKLYVPVLLVSVLGMAPFVVAGSRPQRVTAAFRVAIAVVAIAFMVMSSSSNLSFAWLLIGLALFFSGFNALESMMPSLVSQIAPYACRASAISIYNTFQFAGIFAGGILGGWVFGRFGEYAVFKFAGLAVLGWLLASLVLPAFKLKKSVTIDIAHLNVSQRDELVARIGQLKGIEEVNIVRGETVAYLEVDQEVYDDAELQKLIRT